MQTWLPNPTEGFGLKHLPYGAHRAGTETHLCVRIHDQLLDLAACNAVGLLETCAPELRAALQQPTMNAFLALGPAAWQALRTQLISILSETAPATRREQAARCLHPLAAADLVLPIAIGNYTDFYASLDHARRIGEIFRPDSPLLPNYKHIPLAYHGRASSIVISGTPIRRPNGQARPTTREGAPGFGPSTTLDYEAELAFIIGTGNNLGSPIPIADAPAHLFGVALLNDWSARDIQSWEYQPLGPFLGKSFATTLSPWITPMAALEPFRITPRPRPSADPGPLPYLLDALDQQSGALDIEVVTTLSTPDLHPLARTNTRQLYWTQAQMIAHHTSNGCNLQPGDILGSGTLSGPELTSAGCLMERNRNGAEPIALSEGIHRTWLEDDDEITLSATCERPGVPSIRLGNCSGRILPAH